MVDGTKMERAGKQNALEKMEERWKEEVHQETLTFDECEASKHVVLVAANRTAQFQSSNCMQKRAFKTFYKFFKNRHEAVEF